MNRYLCPKRVRARLARACDNLIFPEFQEFRNYYITPAVIRVISLYVPKSRVRDLPLSFNEAWFLQETTVFSDFERGLS